MESVLIYSNYDAETGVSEVSIQNRYGIYSGKAFLHEEDKEYGSRFLGCEYAEMRAELKFLKERLNVKKIQIETLEVSYKGMQISNKFNADSFEAKHIRKEISHFKEEQKEIEYKISFIKNNLNAKIKEGSIGMRASKKVKVKKGESN